jgi:ubiquinone/menaquinone biosynthesis C-methylase UbiE
MTTDFTAIKQKQQATWATGDFSIVAARIYFAAECLCEAADLQAGWRTLDVATGSGNAAIAAARRGCIAVGADYVPALLQRGRIRAEAEHLSIEFVDGDAEKLPFPDRSFDAVTSIYGSMFAPDHAKAASELARVCKPGGRIALASWTPDGYVGQMFKLFSSFVPPTVPLAPPPLWGTEPHLKTIFGPAIKSIKSNVRQTIMRFRSPEEKIDVFRAYFGPTVKAFAALDRGKQQELNTQWIDLIRRFDRNKGVGPVAVSADYLESVIERA